MDNGQRMDADRDQRSLGGRGRRDGQGGAGVVGDHQFEDMLVVPILSQGGAGVVGDHRLYESWRLRGDKTRGGCKRCGDAVASRGQR